MNRYRNLSNEDLANIMLGMPEHNRPDDLTKEAAQRWLQDQV
jgi:hypothetical protein